MNPALELKLGVLYGCIPGPLPSMKNSRRIVTVRPRGATKARTLSIKSDAALRFLGELRRFTIEAVGFGRVPFAELPMRGKLWLDVICYQRETKKPRRRDVDIELLCDSLQAAGIVEDDWDFWVKTAQRRIDAENPRTEFWIRKADGV